MTIIILDTRWTSVCMEGLSTDLLEAKGRGQEQIWQSPVAGSP